MLTFGIRTILLLLLIGGAIAIIGDYLGQRIGRKRLTLLGLRPRYTAWVITILTGILIVFSTLGIILAISQDARTALFGLEELRTELKDKSRILEETKNELSLKIKERDKINQQLQSSRSALQKAKQETLALQKTKDKLEKKIEVTRKGKVLFEAGETLLTSLIQAGPEKKKLEEGLRQILSASDAYVRSFGIQDEKHLIFVSPTEFGRATALLQSRQNEQIVKVIATRNTLFGEQVPIRFEIIKNERIYRARAEIAEIDIAASLSIPEIEQEIKRLLYTANQSAKEAGVVPDASGSVGSVPYSKIFDLAKKIKANQKKIRLKALAKTDIYSIGPLEIEFKIYYQ